MKIKIILLFSFFCTSTLFCDLQTIKEKYYWPSIKPSVKPNNHGWFVNQVQLKNLLQPSMKLIVELGSWLGNSARFFLDSVPGAVILAVDHWRSDIYPSSRQDIAEILPVLYETFLVNCWSYKERLIPMKTTTLEGLQEIAENGLVPDFIYIDAAHDYESVTNDLEKAWELFPGSVIAGDDWLFGKTFPVRRAVIDFCERHHLSYIAEKNCWWLDYESIALSSPNKIVKDQPNQR